MGLMSALNTSLNGLQLNESMIDVLGNNIANAGTTGFKASKVQFSTQLARTISFGSKASEINGGSNRQQVGLGASTAAITQDFTPGTVAATSSPSDLAIQGDGFFVLNSKDGISYTRDGSFRLDSLNYLSNNQGLRLQGYAVDSNFNLVTTSLSNLQVPLGNLRIAQATTALKVGGALSPQGAVGTVGTLQTSGVLVDPANVPLTSTATLLTNVRNQGDAGTALYAVGNVLSFAPDKGGRQVETKTLTVTATTTLQDMMNFIDNTLVLQGPPANTDVPTDADGIAVGVSLTAGGQVQVKGNRGTINDFNIQIGSLTNNGNVVPFGFTAGANRADGESAATSFTVYDSLGTPLVVRMTATLESQASNLTTYRYFLQSADQSGNDVVIGSSTISFNNVGKVTDTPNNQFSLNRSSSAAVNPMIFNVDFSGVSGISSSGSALSLMDQNGTSPGTLVRYVIDERGTISGAFDNGISRTLGQVVLARFSNPTGLLQSGLNNFQEGVSSGLPMLTTPGEFGTATIRAGALEQSNTDIGRSLVDLIVASTNYRGNARVITSVDQLTNELLQLGR